MPKKRVKKSSKPKAPTSKEIEMQLIENFVKMQRVMANLSVKFDVLSENMTKLLQLFEIAAKSFVQKEEEGMHGDKDLLLKLDTLLEQNKTIATGLTLMEEKVRHRLEPNAAELSGVPRPHSEAELHGLYSQSQRPRPGRFPRF